MMNRRATFCAALVAAGVTASTLAGCTIDSESSSGNNGKGGKAEETTEGGQPNIFTEKKQPGKAGEMKWRSGGTQAGASADLQEAMDSAIEEVVDQYGGKAAVAIAGPDGELTAGDATGFPAWSTIKVPIAIAALRENPEKSREASAAIQNSDNNAALELWNSIDPEKADAVLAEGGSPLTIQREVTRPEFTPFGQTIWEPAQQARFASNLQCIDGAEEVVGYMGNIAGDQSYGLGQIPGARFKGGWGPTPEGKYVVRQFGIVPGSDSANVAIAITVFPGAGSYEEGQAMANALVDKLKPALKNAPAAQC